METGVPKRRANQSQTQPLKKQRVVLGELSNLPNLIVPQPKPLNKAPTTNKNLNKTVDNVVDSKSNINGLVVSEIYKYLRKLEMEMRRTVFDYIERVQTEVTTNMRGILVDWLVEVAEEYKLLSDTLHLAVSYIDRFLSVNPVSKPKLQLLGVSSMLIASKYEEINPPHVEEFCFITDNSYNKAEVVSMEADILKSLNFELGNPTVKTFLRRFTGIACENKKAPNLQFEFMSYYLAELSLLDYYCLRFLPSLVAASVIFLARFIIWPELQPWTSALCECSGYKSVDLKECVLILHDLYMARRGGSFQATREKYKQHKFKHVTNLPAPRHVPFYLFEQ
ncbi:putative cyclin-A3-1 [Abrus precatorius]|uniref:B-like cyclin n=1 Tax=Abrus precatorius TaxID=3816 RepID=A0A8B8LPZ9_ABRPR|nr:putative cyclin-A3-1 [Abrus precatorius]